MNETNVLEVQRRIRLIRAGIRAKPGAPKVNYGFVGGAQSGLVFALFQLFSIIWC